MAHNIDLFTDHEMVTANAEPRVIPPRTDSFTPPPFAIIFSVLLMLFENASKSEFHYDTGNRYHLFILSIKKATRFTGLPCMVSYGFFYLLIFGSFSLILN